MNHDTVGTSGHSGHFVRHRLNHQVLVAPVGTPPADFTQFDKIGYITDDGLPIGLDLPLDAFPIPSFPTIRNTWELALTKANTRRFAGLIFGKYRFPGDKPLIHKGGKP